MNEEISRRDQLQALIRVGRFKPIVSVGIIIGGVFSALLEGVGLSFILPIVRVVQSSGDPTQQADGVLLAFVRAYDFLGVPFTLGTVVGGVSLVITIRWTSTFFIRWLRSALEIDYQRELQTQSFANALDANVEYFDREGSDDILNAIVTQAEYAGLTIRFVTIFLEQFFLSLMYLSVAFILAPTLTLFAIVFLGGFSYVFRSVVDSGYDIGDQVADANEGVQEAVQAGTQGIRDTKLFGLKGELFNDFLDAVNQYARSKIKLRRNEQAINSFYNLLTAISVFVLVYLAIEFANMSLGSLGIFLFAIFRLGPKASNLNTNFYQIENNLPHLVRTQAFIDELARNREPDSDGSRALEEVTTVEFDDVWFSYAANRDDALRGISMEFGKSEFIGLVGQSGAGKSTIASLLARIYEPDAGEIRANGTPIQEIPVDEWRSRIAVVRQNPYIFNDTLRYNVTIGNRGASQERINRACEIAQVTEFLDDLLDGYDTVLGDDGVRLSGGQRQRISIARALLRDADVLVLDEATSDLDSTLEKRVHTAIESREHDRAMLVIAHRLSTVMNADRIYTMESGRITEVGTHEDLVNDEGTYANMYTTQMQRS